MSPALPPYAMDDPKMKPYEALANLLRDWPDNLVPKAGLGLPALTQEERPPTPSTVAMAAAAVLELYFAKNPGYGDSWCRRGEQGVFHNVARKFDRVEQAIVHDKGAPRIDDVADLATYAVMQLAWHIENRYEEFRRWWDHALSD